MREQSVRVLGRIFAMATLMSLALAGCATPETKVRNKLIGLGLSPPLAGCMAEKMVKRLSYAQLRRLGEMGGLAGRDVREVPIGELIRRLRSIDDPEIFSVVSRAAVGCAITG